MTKMRIIGLCGPKYCGKDSAGRFLQEQNAGMQRFRLSKMAGGVKNIIEEVFGWPPELYEHPVLKEQKLTEWPYIEPRWPMMDIANWMRDKYGGDVWARRWERLALQATDWGCHVITDMRFPEEVEMIKRHDYILVYIERPEAEEALAKAQAVGDAMALNQSESHYEMLRREATHLVQNDGEFYKLRNQILSVAGTAFDHWTYWDVPEIAHPVLSTGPDFPLAPQNNVLGVAR